MVDTRRVHKADVLVRTYLSQLTRARGRPLHLGMMGDFTLAWFCLHQGSISVAGFFSANHWTLSCREPIYGFTPLMEAAAAGHEIIVQYFLNHVSDPLSLLAYNLVTASDKSCH